MTNRKMRRFLWEKQHGNCYYCGNQVEFDNSTLDHKKPKSLGGSNRIRNLVMSCGPCNQQKGNENFFNAKDKFKRFRWWPAFWQGDET